MKKIKYLGGSWVDERKIYSMNYKLTVGNVYDVLQEDRHYKIEDDEGRKLYVSIDPKCFEIVYQ